jgi:heme iron utilization protein
VAPELAHLVGGFGKIRWFTMAELLPTPLSGALAESETEIVDHMNTDHRDAIQLYAEKLLGLPSGDWKMAGIDAEGVDLKCAGRIARLAFETPIGTAGEARKALITLVAKARAD